MCIDGGIPCSSSQIFAILEWNMLSLGVLVTFGKTEIDDED